MEQNSVTITLRLAIGTDTDLVYDGASVEGREAIVVETDVPQAGGVPEQPGRQVR